MVERLFAIRALGWGASINGLLAFFVGIYAELKEKKVAGLSPNTWYMISLGEASQVIMYLLARTLLELEEKD